MLPHLPQRTLKDLRQNQFEKSCLFFVRARNPSGLALVPCTLSAEDKCGRKKFCFIQTYTQTHTEKVVQGTLPSYAIRYEEAFFSWKTKNKRLSAARFARLIITKKNTRRKSAANISKCRKVCVPPPAPHRGSPRITLSCLLSVSEKVS